MNRLAERLDSLPGPAWATYAGAFVVLALLQTMAQTAAGRAVNSFNLVMAVSVPYQVGLMHYLIRSAGTSLDEFRPALLAKEAQAEALRYRLTVVPSGGARRAAIGVTLFSLALIAYTSIIDPLGALDRNLLLAGPRLFLIAGTPISLALNSVILVASWWTTGSYAYLMFHQLRTINRIYAEHTDIRLFRLGPMFAFSRHTLRSSLGLLLLAYALFATAPELTESDVGLGSLAGLISGAVIVFLWPLWGIHRRLAQEKNRALAEVGRRIESGARELHRRMDSGRLARMDDLHKALASLDLERAALERAPTWPWEPGTVRSLIAAILIPLILWLVQSLLEKSLGG